MLIYNNFVTIILLIQYIYVYVYCFSFFKDTLFYTMEEDVNSAKKDNYQSCRKKEKHGIRKLFRNGKKIQFKTYNENEYNRNRRKQKNK